LYYILLVILVFVPQSRYIHSEETIEGLPTRARFQSRSLGGVWPSGSIRKSRTDCCCDV